MDINQELNEIIFRYHLDRHYPHYKDKYNAEKILRATVKELIETGEKAVFVGNDETGIEFIRHMAGGEGNFQFLRYDTEDAQLQQLESADWTLYGKVYLISFYGTECVERWFRLHKIRYEWLYDIFEREGVYLQREFFAFGREDLYALFSTEPMHTHRKGWTESIQFELYCQRSKHESADNRTTKRIALEKCFFLTLYLRNFAEAKTYAGMLAREDKRFECAWGEIRNLLSRIKDALQSRRQKDIVLYWLDGLAYGEEDGMHYLQGIKEKSVVFENAFNYMPNTHPVLRSMFLGKKDIDDQVYRVSEITYENSAVMRLLDEHGYGFKVFSGYYHSSFPLRCRSDQIYMDWYEAASMKLWDMLSHMLSEKKQALWLVHMMEPHSPCLSSRISDENYLMPEEWRRQAKIEIDQQISFCEELINGNAVRIYMSDHGHWDALHARGKLRFHVLFNVCHRDLKPRKVSGMFSLLDFAVLLKQIVASGSIREQEFVREYVEIGDFDRYNRSDIEQLLRNKGGLPMGYFGFRGIVDKEYIYVKYKMGREWMQRRDAIPLVNPMLFYGCASDVCEPQLLPKYRALAGEGPEGLEADEKFRYSKHLYRIYHKILKHNPLPDRVDAINDMVGRYGEQTVAIRMGGEHSAMLYYILSEENKRKIWGFIDNNGKCLCQKLNLPVIRSDQKEYLKESGVKAVLLSSHVFLNVLREEAEEWRKNFDVLDVYGCLERNGMRCGDSFWIVKGNDEDYDVDFPFGEGKD